MTTKRFGRRTIELSNEQKILFPDDGITKGDLVEYYERACERMLPHVKARPLMLQRFPNGIASFGFYQKQSGGYFPDWIRTVRVKKQGGVQDLVVCDDSATLVYLANQAAIVLHPWLSRVDRIDYPDVFVIDLDPPSGEFAQVRSAARHCKRLLDELEFPAFLKTTGSKGLHVVVPLAGRESFDSVRQTARALTDVLAARHPDELTTEHRKDKRGGRIYLDVARNAYAQTAVAPYSVRALPGAPVSAPIEWAEIGRRGFDSRFYTIRNVLRRSADPWADLRRSRCSMATLARRLETLRRPRAA
jgi:bifunctional non-homologous end joining protein LigD